MALIKCKECGKEVSSKAETCPNCGARIAKKPMGCGTLIAVIVLGVIIIGSFSSIFSSGGNKSSASSAAYQAPATNATQGEKVDTSNIPTLDTAPKGGGDVARQQWQYADDKDAMTDKISHFASIKSKASLDLKFPYNGANYATLFIRKRPTEGLSAFVVVDKGQILCTSYSGCSVSVRFDDGKPIGFSANGASDGDSKYVFISNASKFIERAKKAKRILFQVEMYQEGRQVIEFTPSEPLVWK